MILFLLSLKMNIADMSNDQIVMMLQPAVTIYRELLVAFLWNTTPVFKLTVAVVFSF